jgi:surfeit locus 1 family protein
VPALAVLVALGGWQLYRMQWKSVLIEELQIRERAPAIPLPLDSRIPAADLTYRPVRVTGRFIHDAETYLLNRVREGTPGINVITPFVRTDGGPTLMVNRGWAPLDWPERAQSAKDTDDREVEVTGIVRTQDPPGWLTPQNRPDKNEWYYIDLSAMAGSVGVLPFVDYYIYATGETPLVDQPARDETVGLDAAATPDETGTPPAPAFPVANTWRTDLPNNHLSYAITWFSLAATLLVVYIVHRVRHVSGTDADGGD